MTLSSSAVAAAHGTSQRYIRSKVLDKAIPKLRGRFARLANSDGAFPIFSPSVHDMVWNTVPKLSERQAAVLVPLVSYNGAPSLLFTTRSSKLRSHASEVSFPGGHFHEGVDSCLEDTALRECQEELLGDYPWHDIEIIGRATAVPSLGGIPVTPIIGVLPYEITDCTFPGNADEVVDIFCVELTELLAIEMMERPPAVSRFKTMIPSFPTAAGQRIWGLTAVVTKPLLHKLFKPVFLGEDIINSSMAKPKL